MPTPSPPQNIRMKSGGMLRERAMTVPKSAPPRIAPRAMPTPAIQPIQASKA